MLIGLVTAIALIFAGLMLNHLNRGQLKKLKIQKSQSVLVEAKQALLAYSTETFPAAPNCSLNCPRPGDLPCPDLNNDGEAESSCNTQASRIGRLPWKTLGLNDLKDGDGESLWYAVSDQYKNNPRVIPLNSDSVGSISLRNSQGILTFDASSQQGLAAVLIAPHQPITRADGFQQVRDTQNSLSPSNYLETAYNEDNASFIDNQVDGFISGEIKLNDRVIVNDLILPVTNVQMQTVMQKRVLGEVMQAILFHYCNGQLSVHNRNCTSNGTYYPAPAAINDASCLSNANLSQGNCFADEAQLIGRIPVTMTDPNNAANDQLIWEQVNVNAILRGTQVHNWFQQNGWREHILYARAPACDVNNSNCTGTSFLTLNNSLTPTANTQSNNKHVVLISAGSALANQSRTTNTNKGVLSNYLEDENANPLDTVFSRLPRDNTHNDIATSIP